MRAIFGVLGLVIVVAIIGVVAKKQLTSVAVPQVNVTVPGAAAAQPAQQGGAPATPRQQMDQLKQGLESTLQQPREIPGESK